MQNRFCYFRKRVLFYKFNEKEPYDLTESFNEKMYEEESFEASVDMRDEIYKCAICVTTTRYHIKKMYAILRKVNIKKQTVF